MSFHSRAMRQVVAVDMNFMVFTRVWCIAELVEARETSNFCWDSWLMWLMEWKRWFFPFLRQVCWTKHWHLTILNLTVKIRTDTNKSALFDKPNMGIWWAFAIRKSLNELIRQLTNSTDVWSTPFVAILPSVCVYHGKSTRNRDLTSTRSTIICIWPSPKVGAKFDLPIILGLIDRD